MEEWKRIPGFDGYEASTLGRIRSLKYKTPRILKRGHNLRGYPQHHVSVGGVDSTVTVHRLVALAFFGPRLGDMQTNHKDGDKENARPSNLEYITGEANHRHAVDTDLKAFGERQHSAKLRQEDIVVIKRSLQDGVPGQRLARLYEVVKQTIYNIRDGKTWRRVAVLVLLTLCSTAFGQEGKDKKYTLTEVQQLRLQVMQRDAQLLQVRLQETQRQFQEKVSELMATAQKVKLEQGWPPETVFNPDTLQFSAPPPPATPAKEEKK